MPNITMDDFIDECLTGKKPKKKKIIEGSSVGFSSLFEDEESKDLKKSDSVVDTKKANKKTTKDDVDEQKPDEEKTDDEDKVLSLVLTINEKTKIKKFTKEQFVNDVPLNFQSILKQLGLDLDQISLKAAEELDSTPEDEESPLDKSAKEDKQEENAKYNKLRLTVKEFITSGAGNEKVELSWRRDGDGESAVETAEVITSNGSMPFTDSPDPLNAAITTFDRIYYDDIVSKIRKELDSEANG